MNNHSTTRLRGRQELRVLIPVALLTLVMISVGTLFSYRSSVEMMSSTLEREATDLAVSLAGRLESEQIPSPHSLRQLVPRGAHSAIRDHQGQLVVATSPFENAGEIPTGRAHFSRSGNEWMVEVELPSPVLAQSRGRLRVLMPMVLAVDLAVVLLVLVYLRKLLQPLEQILTRAQRTGRYDPTRDDEVDFLVAAFDSAMRELSAAPNQDLESVKRLLIADLESGVLLCDRDARVLALNPAGASLLGLSASIDGSADVEAENSTLSHLLAREPRLASLLTAAMETGRGISRQEVVLESANQGSPTTLGLTLHVLRRDDLETRGYLILFVDLTRARQQAGEERLGETFQQLGEIAAGIAHELRNGVATLRGYLTLIERAEGEDVSDYSAELRRETEHLQRVVDDFLTLSRPGVTRLERLDVSSLVHRAVADPALGETIDVEVDAEHRQNLVVLGDLELLVRALRNLLLNALQATSRESLARPSIEVREVDQGQQHLEFEIPFDQARSEHQRMVEIAVLDRGPGLPRKVREKLFHPFVTGRKGGVGLGLSLCLRIAHLHDGTLRFEDRDGGGTRAAFLLPLRSSGADVTEGNEQESIEVS